MKRRKALARLALSMLAVLLGGCGSSGSTPTVISHVSAGTDAGVRFTAEVAIHDGRECFTQHYAILARHTKPFQQTTESCAPSSRPAGPLLIEVARPRTVFIFDRPPGRCTQVSITAAHARSIAVEESCSATRPTLRLIPLPPDTILTIHGMAGVTRLDLRKYPCSPVCPREIVASR